jgi:hypothetical protein
MLGLLAMTLTTLSAVWLLRTSEVSAVPPATEPPPAGSAPAGVSPTAAQEGTAAAATEPPQDPNTATIIIATVPAATANVTWGRKLLGRIKPGKPLVVKRPRDSGPLDIMVRAVGFLPVQTRAHTFSDNRVIVKLTRPESVMELWGYRAPQPDAGVLTPEQAAAQNAVTPAVPATQGFTPVAPPTSTIAPAVPPPPAQ